MNKKILTSIGVITSVFILVFGFYNSKSAQIEPSLTTTEIKKLVTEQYPGEIDEPTLNLVDNKPIYTTKVTHDKNMYQIKVDGHSGDVLDITKQAIKKTAKVEDKKTEPKVTAKDNNKKTEANEKTPERKKQTESNKMKVESNPSPEALKKTKQNSQEKPIEVKKVNPPKKEKNTVISREQVRDIALKQFPGVVDDIDLEENNGRLVYEVEIENDKNDSEAEIEIDAYTGEVILIEIDED